MKKLILFLFLIINTFVYSQTPQNFNVSNITQNSATLKWNKISGATQYKVKYTSDAVWDTIFNPTDTFLNLSNLSSGVNYRCVVREQSPIQSAYTNELTFTTLTNGGGGGGGTSGITPTFNHIFTVILENHGYSQIVGASGAPNFNAYINNNTLYKTALFTNSYALTHPSEPNYLMLISGTNQGVTNDACPVGPFNTQCIQSQLGGLGKSYKAYEEDLPSVGSTTCSSGNYVRRHCVWNYFNTVNHNMEVPFTQ